MKVNDVAIAERMQPSPSQTATAGLLSTIAQHVPSNLNDIIQKEDGRQQAGKQKLAQMVREFRSKCEEEEMEPSGKLSC